MDVLGTNNPPPNNNHGEGIPYDTANGHLFVSDGPNQEIYEYAKSGGSPLNHFDVAQYGVGDPEAVEYNSASDTLFTLSNRPSGPTSSRPPRAGRSSRRSTSLR